MNISSLLQGQDRKFSQCASSKVHLKTGSLSFPKSRRNSHEVKEKDGMLCCSWIQDVYLSPAPVDLWKMETKCIGKNWEDCISQGLPESSVFSPQVENKTSSNSWLLYFSAELRAFNILNLAWKFLLRQKEVKACAWHVLRFESLPFIHSCLLPLLMVERRRGGKEVSKLPVEGREGRAVGWGLVTKRWKILLLDYFHH